MRSSTLFSATLLMAIAQAADKFNLVVIRSGTDIQNTALTLQGDKLVAGGKGAGFVGSWRADDAVEVNGKFLGADPESDLGLVGTDSAAFSNKEGYLAYKGSQSFTAVPGNGNSYYIRIGAYPGAVAEPVALKIMPVEGNQTYSSHVPQSTSHHSSATHSSATHSPGTHSPATHSSATHSVPISKSSSNHNTCTQTKCKTSSSSSPHSTSPAPIHTSAAPVHSETKGQPVQVTTTHGVPGPVHTDEMEQVNGAAYNAVGGVAALAGLAAALL